LTSVEQATVSAEASPPPCSIASPTCPQALVTASPTGAGTVTVGGVGGGGVVVSGTLTATEALVDVDQRAGPAFALPPALKLNDTSGCVVVVVVGFGFGFVVPAVGFVVVEIGF